MKRRVIPEPENPRPNRSAVGSRFPDPHCVCCKRGPTGLFVYVYDDDRFSGPAETGAFCSRACAREWFTDPRKRLRKEERIERVRRAVPGD